MAARIKEKNNKKKPRENPNLLKLRQLAVHIELFFAMWFISQIENVKNLVLKISHFEEHRIP